MLTLELRTLANALQAMDDLRRKNKDKVAFNMNSRSILPVASKDVHPRIDLLLNQVAWNPFCTPSSFTQSLLFQAVVGDINGHPGYNNGRFHKGRQKYFMWTGDAEAELRWLWVHAVGSASHYTPYTGCANSLHYSLGLVPTQTQGKIYRNDGARSGSHAALSRAMVQSRIQNRRYLQEKEFPARGGGWVAASSGLDPDINRKIDCVWSNFDISFCKVSNVWVFFRLGTCTIFTCFGFSMQANWLGLCRLQEMDISEFQRGRRILCSWSPSRVAKNMKGKNI